MAAPICPVRTAAPRSLAEECSDAVPQLRAYKLGHRRWSYNLVELQLREGGDGSAAGRTAAVVHAAASGARFPPPHQDSAVGFQLQLDSGAKVQAHVYLCYADAQPCSSGGGGGGGEEEEELFGWRLVTRQHCCKGCQGPVLRSIQRFGRVGSRQARQSVARQQPASGTAGAEPGGSPGGGQPSRKDPRFMYLSLDEACTHVGATAFRLVAGIYNRQGSSLLGTAVSPPIRVLSNNDAPTGAARIVLEATLPSDWEGWSRGGSGDGSGGSLSGKRSTAAPPAQRQQKRPHSALSAQSAECAEQPGMPSMPSMALEPTPGMLVNSSALPAHAPASPAEQGGQQLQGPASPVPQAFARQLSLPLHPPFPLLLASGSSPPSPADMVPAGGLCEAVLPATLAAHLASSLPLYSCSQAAAQQEAERQIALLQQLKASMAAAGSAAASSCGSPPGDAACCGGSSGAGWAAAAALQPQCLPGMPVTPAGLGFPAYRAIPGFPITLSPSGSLATATSALPPACAVALDRAGSSGGSGGGSGGGGSAYCSPAGAGCSRLSPPLPAAQEPGLGLGLGREYSLDDELDLLQLHGGMDSFDCCGMDDLGVPSIFDDADALAFAF